MRTYDNYSLKNASLKFKILTTFWLAFSFALIAWSWFISLTVVNWYSSGLMKHWMLGPELFQPVIRIAMDVPLEENLHRALA